MPTIVDIGINQRGNKMDEEQKTINIFKKQAEKIKDVDRFFRKVCPEFDKKEFRDRFSEKNKKEMRNDLIPLKKAMEKLKPLLDEADKNILNSLPRESKNKIIIDIESIEVKENKEVLEYERV